MNKPRLNPSSVITRTQLGFGMVELMLALALGLVIVAAMGQLYGGSKKAYQVGDSLTRLNENGRFAVDLLARELRMAGYLSCGGSDADIANTVNGVGHWLYQVEGVEGFEGGVDNPPDELAGLVRADTDILIIRRAAVDLGQGLENDAPADAKMELGSGHGLETGGIVVISDASCTQASLFQVTDVLATAEGDDIDGIVHAGTGGPSPGNCTDALFGNFDCADTSGATSRPFGPGSTLEQLFRPRILRDRLRPADPGEPEPMPRRRPAQRMPTRPDP